MVTYDHLGKYDPYPLDIDASLMNTLESHDV